MNADPVTYLFDQTVSLLGILNLLLPAFRADSPGLPLAFIHRAATKKAVGKGFVTFLAIKLGKTGDPVINPGDKCITGLARWDLFH